MQGKTFAFKVTIKGKLTVDEDELRQDAEMEGLTLEEIAMGRISDTLLDVALPSTGPLVVDEVKAPVENIRFLDEPDDVSDEQRVWRAANEVRGVARCLRASQ